MLFSISSVDIASYADDNTLYTTGKKNKCEVEKKLQIASVKLFKWFHENGMEANQDKCDFLSNLDLITELKLLNCSFKNSSSEKLLAVTIDIKHNFHEHVTNLCNIESKKI